MNMPHIYGYMLDEHKIAIPVYDPIKWAESMSIDNRRVALTQIGYIRVSTVFLGLDHNFFGEGDPILFETMVFCDEDWGGMDIMERYSSWAEAKAGHDDIVRLVTGIDFAAHNVTIDLIHKLRAADISIERAKHDSSSQSRIDPGSPPVEGTGPGSDPPWDD